MKYEVRARLKHNFEGALIQDHVFRVSASNPKEALCKARRYMTAFELDGTIIDVVRTV